MSSISILWLRQDLRLHDNPALLAATANGAQVIPVYILDDDSAAGWRAGGASRWWLNQSLASMERELTSRGSRLILKEGDSAELLTSLAKQSGASAVFWNRCFEPAGRALEEKVTAALRRSGIAGFASNGSLLHEPEAVRTLEGQPFKVFTPFWKRFTAMPDPQRPAGKPERMMFPDVEIESLPLSRLELMPTIDWAGGFRQTWVPGEAGAHASLKNFINGPLSEYATGRDRPDLKGVSMLSPHLHFGEISPRQIWYAISSASITTGSEKDLETYLKEIGWREFAYHILYNFPKTSDEPLREQFKNFAWLEDRESLKKWQRGQTGYPIVDAGMRELWHIGWMHNRVRMIVASFLTKDLLISWNHGARWFWDTLVDADLASNSMGWQWAAGCGADAAPFFRIFNPILQGEKFDRLGHYVKKWVPELSAMPPEWIHKPWQAPQEVLRSANVALGKNYPHPIIDHAFARKRALAVYACK